MGLHVACTQQWKRHFIVGPVAIIKGQLRPEPDSVLQAAEQVELLGECTGVNHIRVVALLVAQFMVEQVKVLQPFLSLCLLRSFLGNHARRFLAAFRN